jgi:O-antigen/teichoic acid export membrane protein
VTAIAEDVPPAGGAPRRHGLAVNALSNLVGSVVTSLASLVVTPFLVHFLGMAAYGLVGVYVTVQAVVTVFDLGMSLALTREMARMSAQPGAAPAMRDFARTLEAIYWGVGAVLCVVGIVLAPLFADRWFPPGSLPAAEVRGGLVLIAVATTVRWPLSFYGQGLVGLQRLVRWSVVRVVAELVRNGGVILVLWVAAPTVRNFFLWQIGTGALTVAWAAASFWMSMPAASTRPRVDAKSLEGSLGFAAGTWAVGLTSVLLVYLDRIVLSRSLPLDRFGDYTLAATLAAGLSMISAPLFQAFFPRLTQLVVERTEGELAVQYHRACQWIAVAVFPLAAALCVDSREVMETWTRSSEVAARAAPLLSFLALAGALNTAMNMPYALQLAHGWTRLTLKVNLAALCAVAPLLLWLVPAYGAIAAAAVSLGLNLVYVGVSVPFTHRRLLPGELLRWYRADLLVPLFAALAGAWAGALACRAASLPSWRGAVPVAVSLVLAEALTLAATPASRIAVYRRLREWAAGPRHS